MHALRQVRCSSLFLVLHVLTWIATRDTYAPQKASTACRDCAVGFFSASYNRTACTPCQAIDASVMPFAEYFQKGCALRCKPVVSYVRIRLT